MHNNVAHDCPEQIGSPSLLGAPGQAKIKIRPIKDTNLVLGPANPDYRLRGRKQKSAVGLPYDCRRIYRESVNTTLAQDAGTANR